MSNKITRRSKDFYFAWVCKDHGTGAGHYTLDEAKKAFQLHAHKRHNGNLSELDYYEEVTTTVTVRRVSA